MDFLGWNRFETIKRIGPGRSIGDDTLYEWLDMKSTFDQGDNYLGYFQPSAKLNLQRIEAMPTFGCDSVSFCAELTKAVHQAIADGFDKSMIDGQNGHIFRLWDYAELYTERNRPPTTKPARKKLN